MSENNLPSFETETEEVIILGEYIQLSSPININLGNSVDLSPYFYLSVEQYEVYLLLKSWECKDQFISEIRSKISLDLF